MENGGFTVAVGSFAGPFDLLLSLIDKRKLLVSDVSLAQVADDYLAYVKGKHSFPVEETSQFIVVASTLLLIKSKSLLPELDLSDEEEREADDLARRLALYQLYRECAQGLGRAFGHQILLAKAKPETLPPTFLPTAEVSLEGLEGALVALLASREAEGERLPETAVAPTMSIEEAMSRLAERVTRLSKVSFKDLAGDRPKVEVIVHFLALLELVKQGVFDAEQEGAYGDITFERTAVSAPHYG